MRLLQGACRTAGIFFTFSSTISRFPIFSFVIQYLYGTLWVLKR